MLIAKLSRKGTATDAINSTQSLDITAVMRITTHIYNLENKQIMNQAWI